MTEILISSQIYNKPQFSQMCGEPLEDLYCNGQHGVMWAYPTLYHRPDNAGRRRFYHAASLWQSTQYS